MNFRSWSLVPLVAAGTAVTAGMCQPAAAATLCVNPGGKGWLLYHDRCLS
jgi:hypothetical protein